MKKVILQLMIFAGVFFATWFLLSRIDWMTIFKVKHTTKKTEEKLGDLFWNAIKQSETEVQSSDIVAPIDTLITHICKANDIDRKKIKLHIIKKDDINAFALPDNHLIVYTGLIDECDNEAELCGVLGHEIAHMEKNHVMRKLVNEIGLSVLISITTGSKSAEITKQALRMLSSTAYERRLETEADMTSVDYMIKAQIDPTALANFMFRLSSKQGDISRQLSWISSHPESEERLRELLIF